MTTGKPRPLPEWATLLGIRFYFLLGMGLVMSATSVLQVEIGFGLLGLGIVYTWFGKRKLLLWVKSLSAFIQAHRGRR